MRYVMRQFLAAPPVSDERKLNWNTFFSPRVRGT
jgi:hypothetical protein